ncbi:MAG TPA: YeeE/YedE family protein [Telluria sp.]|nr:YeeE/YedE family protein [Telluria sp.]
MSIDLLHFTPGPALAGGILIGLAAALSILFSGRIAGISGIVGGLMRPAPGDIGWRIAFIVGIFAAPLVLMLAGHAYQPQADTVYPLLIPAGLLVGFGTRLGNGCTSGHGVCGLSRLSLRSLAATVVFMGAGMAAVFVLRHALG